MQNTYFTYILASQRNGTLYTGVTNDLERRAAEHRAGLGGSFTRRYKVHRLVWFEEHGDIEQAILRERRLKKWKRAWKLALIEKENPEWVDLSFEGYSAVELGPRLCGDDRGVFRRML